MENFEKQHHLLSLKNATLIAVDTGFNDPFLAWLLLDSFNFNEDPIL